MDNRLRSIDQFRGLAVLLMVVANYLAGVELVPAWLKHAPDIGLTVIDLIAPFFIFAIGLTYGPSWRRRSRRDGGAKAVQHFITRFLVIFGIGTLLSAVGMWLRVDDTTVNWGVLQAIGGAGMSTLLVIGLPLEWRLGMGIGVLALYQIALESFWLGMVLHSPHGGMLGSISWAAMMILTTVLADLFHDRSRTMFGFAATGALLIGLGLAFLFPISKSRVSVTYVLVSLGISGLVFGLFDSLVPRLPLNLSFLSAWGRNPLLLYLLHLLLIGIVFLPGVPGWYAEAPLWLVSIQSAVLLGTLSAVTLWLERRAVIVSL